MRTITIALAAALAVLASAASHQAHADTISAAAGMQSNGEIPTCYHFGHSAVGFIGVEKASLPEWQQAHFVVPLFWDRFYSASTTRTIRVHGKLMNSSATLTCFVHIVDSDGSMLSSDIESFSTVGSYSNVTLQVNTVISGATGYVGCMPNGPGSLILSIDYSA